MSVLREEKRRTGSDSWAGATKSCRTSSDIGVEQENHNVRRGPMQDQKGLKECHHVMEDHITTQWNLKFCNTNLFTICNICADTVTCLLLSTSTVMRRITMFQSTMVVQDYITVFARIICAPPRILHSLIFKGWFWIYFCSAYFTHHRIVHLPVISRCSHWL